MPQASTVPRSHVWKRRITSRPFHSWNNSVKHSDSSRMKYLLTSLFLCPSSYCSYSSTVGGLVPTRLISPPDVKIETTFFQRKFFITTPCNHPQKQHKKRTSDLSEVPILRCFLKILPLSAPLPASYQIPPDCTLNGIYPSNDTSFLYPIRTFSISFAALAHC